MIKLWEFPQTGFDFSEHIRKIAELKDYIQNPDGSWIHKDRLDEEALWYCPGPFTLDAVLMSMPSGYDVTIQSKSTGVQARVNMYHRETLVSCGATSSLDGYAGVMEAALLCLIEVLTVEKECNTNKL